MGSDDQRKYFVITTRGDRGPMDRAGLRELLKAGEATREDHVRNAFGRPLGTVAEILSGPDPARSSRPRMVPPAPVPERNAKRPTMLLVGIAAAVVVAILVAVLVSGAPAPAPSSPTETPQPPAGAVQTAPSATHGPAVPPAETPRSGWTLIDIGGSQPAGTLTEDAGSLRITGGGTEVGGKQDACAFAQRTVGGRSTMTVRLVSMQDTPPAGGQAGLMLRGDATPGSPQVALWVRSTGEVTLVRRSEPGKAAVAAKGPKLAFPLWLRLERQGNRVTASTSADGSAWTAFPQVQVLPTFTDAVQGGLMACGRKATQACAAVFDKLAITGE